MLSLIVGHKSLPPKGSKTGKAHPNLGVLKSRLLQHFGGSFSAQECCPDLTSLPCCHPCTGSLLFLASILNPSPYLTAPPVARLLHSWTALRWPREVPTFCWRLLLWVLNRRLKTKGEWAFQSSGPSLWPSLPFSSVDRYKKLVFRQPAQDAWLLLLWF